MQVVREFPTLELTHPAHSYLPVCDVISVSLVEVQFYKAVLPTVVIVFKLNPQTLFILQLVPFC